MRSYPSVARVSTLQQKHLDVLKSLSMPSRYHAVLPKLATAFKIIIQRTLQDEFKAPI
jgi:hypothetical protein